MHRPRKAVREGFVSLLNVAGVSFRHNATRELFQNAAFSIDPGNCLAIVGANGAGKSTMLRLLAGELAPVDGSIARRNGLRLAMVDQRWPQSGVSLFDYVFGARNQLAGLRAEMAATEAGDPCRFAELVNDYAAAGGYAAEAETERLLAGLGFAEQEWRLPLGSLSGGQRTRAGLARALHTESDLLLLDEPTEHLDIRAREWLGAQLAGVRTCVVVSHDRAFLRSIATRVLEIERGRVRLFEGGYDFYRNARQLADRQAWEAYEGYERRRTAMQAASQRRSQLAAQVATAPAGTKGDNDFYARKSAKVARTARLLRERVDRGPVVEKPWEEQPIPKLDFGSVRRSGDVVLSAVGLSKAYGQKVLLRDLTLQLVRGERLAISGPNGAGKTTLLRLLLGLEPPDAGEVRQGAHVIVGHYAQDAENLDRSLTPLEICGSHTQARTMLACLKVHPDRVDQPLSQASAGECAKVALARLLVSGANLLVLDEPTNHLDIEAQEALEQALPQYPGAVVLVTHDRAFLEAMAPRQVIRLPS
ncbi:MAG: ABC-F family ATP-binding cassette domain-containing protein [Bryobacterales bacterium]|nr:ABC-F family ATP-binding cassette domain-containing protein [Bryobacterales bacterium]